MRELHRRLVTVCETAGCDRQIIFVDDGSTDASAQVIAELSAKDPTVTGLLLSRNFGHEAASTAGLDAAVGDAAVLMDADLQDPPEVILEMLKFWKQGKQIIYAVRKQRHGETRIKRATAWVFYRTLNWLSEVDIPMDTGDFRLIDGRVLKALRRCREQDRFVRGLIAWTGFRTAAVYYDRPARLTGETHYGFWRLLLLSIDAAVGFSITPLRITTWLGFVTMAFSALLAVIIIVQKLLVGIPLPGYALLTSGLFFLGGVQMLMLGILGEYIGRIYRQAQGRPLYVVGDIVSAAQTTASIGIDASQPSGQTNAGILRTGD